MHNYNNYSEFFGGVPIFVADWSVILPLNFIDALNHDVFSLTVYIFLLLQLGGEGGAPSSNETYQRLKMFMRASAVLILPVTVTFPAVCVSIAVGTLDRTDH